MKHLLFILLTIMLVQVAKAQCINDTLDVGSDTTLCTGQSVTLTANQAYISHVWNTGSTAASITVNTPGTYICTAKIVDSSNLVINGDFFFGNMFFTSNYIYGTGGAYGLLSNEGQFAISTNSSLTHNNFANCTDHTSGTGNFMIVNGSSTANLSVWCQTISVYPNTDYIFSAWFTSVHSSNPAILNFSIDGNSIGPNAYVSSTTCYWQNFFQTWTSNAIQTTATICIKNQNVNPSGNDFAIDDIYFAQVCKWHDTVVVGYNTYPTPNLGNDTLLCHGDSLVLSATADSISTYLWNNNSTDSILTAYNSGTYHVIVSNGNCTGTDTMNLIVVPYPVVNLGNDTLICSGDSITLDAGINPGNISWNDNSTGQTLDVGSTGTYWVSIDNQGCADSDSIDITISQGPNPTLSPTYTFCEGDSIELDPGSFASYEWNTGSISQQIYVSENGTNSYDVQVWDSDGCTDSVSTEVTMVEMPLPKIIASNDTICLGNTLILNASGGENYFWNTGEIGPDYEFQPTQSATFQVTVSNSENGVNCQADTSVFVFVKDCNTLYVPNAFTPNGDGLNDYFLPIGEFNLDSYEFMVFDRWGTLIFSTTKVNHGWDGKFKGEILENGVYSYLVRAKEPHAETYEIRGTVHLIR